MKGNIDRIEEGYLVVIMDDGSIKNLESKKYPDLLPGMIIEINKEIKILKDEQEELREKISYLQNKLFKKGE